MAEVNSSGEVEAGRTSSGQAYPYGDLILNSTGPFGDQMVSNRYPLIELNAAFPLSLLRDVQYTTGTGVINDTVLGEYQVRHTTGGDNAHLLTARRGRYMPGFGGEAGIGIRLDGSITDASSVGEWGYFDVQPGTNTVQNGAMFGYDSGGLYVRVVRNAVEVHKEYQQSWNIDANYIANPFDGKGRIYQLGPFSYYGYGLVEFRIVEATSGDIKQIPHLVHTYAPSQGSTLGNPNLQVGARVSSTAGTDDFSLYVSGRKFHVLGEYAPQDRVTADTRRNFATGGTVAPVISFRRKTNRRETTVKPLSFSALVANENTIITVRIGSTLTGAVWSSLTETPPAETSLEYDISATAIDTATGTKIYEGGFAAGQGSQSASGDIQRLLTEAPDEAVISFCAETVSGAAGSVTLTGRVLEEW